MRRAVAQVGRTRLVTRKRTGLRTISSSTKVSLATEVIAKW